MDRSFLRLSMEKIQHIPRSFWVLFPGLQPDLKLLACSFIGVKTVSSLEWFVLPQAG